MPPHPVVLRAVARPGAPALTLRPWRPTDAPALVEALRDPVLRRWTSHRVDDEAEAARWIAAQQEGWAAGTRFCFAVTEEGAGPEDAGPEDGGRPGGPLVGQAVLKTAGPGAPTAEVGYWTAAPARGRGVAPRALRALTDWACAAFAPAGLSRLELVHQVDNDASCRVAEKTGYVLDGILPAGPPAFPQEGHRHVRIVTERSRFVTPSNPAPHPAV
ncbi:GNAT family N-acetyltransferase [Streptomyces sp. NPDC005811]|uniref:GNAT family N-acetyltransferase n=1 Tax=Streptomyces sp. NPDC005811 TaxID=3154565 RepID=UPI0033F86F04